MTMATIFYVRKGSQPAKIASSRDVSVEDIVSLYGPDPANYTHMRGAESPDISDGKGEAEFCSDPAHAVVRIDPGETGGKTFPEAGFYIVKEERI
jgi:hypothetical protein